MFMKNQDFSPIILLCALFVCLSVGLFFGRNMPAQWNEIPVSPSQTQPDISAIDLNSADTAALMGLPGIGEVLAQRIIQHREANGPFASTAQLLNIEGIGEEILENLLPYITAGG